MGQCVSKKKNTNQNVITDSTIDHQNKLIDKVLEKKKFQLYSITEFGKFGPVINVKYPPMRQQYSVKILTQDNIGEEEIIWYKLYNDNILSLIHIEFVEKINVFLFYTEDWEYTLTDIYENNFLKNTSDGINRVIKWITHIAEAMKYIHNKNLYHLNLTEDNIVITEKDQAKIRNFHWICSKDKFQQK